MASTQKRGFVPGRVSLDKAVTSRELNDFISAKDLIKVSAFDIIGARKFNNQILFDVEYLDGKAGKQKLVKRAVTLDPTEDRLEVLEAVKQHKRIGPVKLDRLDISAGRTYLKFVPSKDVSF